MGKTRDNLFADGFTGKMGKNMVFRQKKSGTVIVAKSPRKTRNPLKPVSAGIRETFKDAVAYAKAITKNPVYAQLKAAYALAIKGDETAYNLALKDAIIAPIVNAVITTEYTGAIGSRILVKATDDFQVVSVKVSIRLQDGTIIEEGDALLDDKDRQWIYTATVLNNQLAETNITATAIDNPNNQGVLVAIL